MVYRTLHRLSPIYLQDTITVTSHVGRNSYRFFVPRVWTNYGKHSLYYTGTQVWNSLHASLYTAATHGQFKYLHQSNFNCVIAIVCNVYRALLKISSFILNSLPFSNKKIK